jgi:hypothetical protein
MAIILRNEGLIGPESGCETMTLAIPRKVLPIEPVTRTTVQDHVYLKMKELILNGDIEPGRMVTIQSRCAKS